MREAQVEKANYFLLVRNIHRIEKGLLMRPRRAVFAKDYIRETVDSYIGVVTKQTDSPSQLAWFTDVLDSYFNTSGEDKVVIKEKERYDSFKQSLNGKLANLQCEFIKIPYHRNESLKPNISYEDFYKLNKYRRSVRWFLTRPVPRELIDKAILVASQAPSACNRQPFEYYIIDNPELVKEAVKLPMGTTGYAHSIQTFIVVVGNLDSYFDERDRHLIYIDASLANMSLMLALETLGLGSVSINWPDIESREQKMEKFLKLGPHQRPIMCIGVGFPDPEGMVAFSEKRDLNQIRKFL
ncbi:nitroreductase family protein [Pontibacter mucosus]|nr:nitroreductase family protein [Pontibacter mucosus]